MPDRFSNSPHETHAAPDPAEPFQGPWNRWWPLLAWAAFVLPAPAAVALLGTPAPPLLDFDAMAHWRFWHEGLPLAVIVSATLGGLFVAAGRRSDQRARIYTVLLGLLLTGLALGLLHRVLSRLHPLP